MPLARTRWEASWSRRPEEEACNLNPAFCGELISRSTSEFHRLRGRPFNFGLAFVVLPIALHKRTRDELPGNASAAFLGWVAEHGPSLADLPDRIARLLPVTREALLFLVQHDVLKVQEGGLVPGNHPIRLTSKASPTTDDVDEARRAAALLGRWFAGQGLPSAILQGLGVKP
jgi:hypothetical protein